MSSQPESSNRLDTWGWIYLILGLGSVANALWMLAGPMHWYTGPARRSAGHRALQRPLRAGHRLCLPHRRRGAGLGGRRAALALAPGGDGDALPGRPCAPPRVRHAARLPARGSLVARLPGVYLPALLLLVASARLRRGGIGGSA